MVTNALLTSLMNFTYETSGEMTDEEALGFVAFMMAFITAYTGFIILLIIVTFVISGIGMMKMFDKAGITSWYAWIPIYNSYKLTEIVLGNGLFLLLILIPSVGGLIWTILIGVKIAPAYGKGIGITLLTIFLTPIAYLILGFGDARYIGPQYI